MKMKWWHAVIGLVVLVGGYAGYRLLSVPAPGVRMDEQGRQHVTPQEVAAFKYNSNPPTSGPHLPTWVKAGIYDTPQSEGELIHSLEHGYVIISYNCTVHLSQIFNFQFSIFNQFSMLKFQKVFAHEDENASPSADFVDPTIATGSPSTELRVNAVNETDACKTLIRQLKELAERKRLWKLIVVPRPQLDTTLAVTAWGAIDKFDPDPIGIDAKRIERFIDFHRDHGPEKTME